MDKNKTMKNDKLILGSVSDGVIHRVRCPVLIVR